LFVESFTLPAARKIYNSQQLLGLHPDAACGKLPIYCIVQCSRTANCLLLACLMFALCRTSVHVLEHCVRGDDLDLVLYTCCLVVLQDAWVLLAGSSQDQQQEQHGSSSANAAKQPSSALAAAAAAAPAAGGRRRGRPATSSQPAAGKRSKV
jgi:hypothetical protein